ncbi:hypothetical protein [Paractinoplanes durhamensis]|uniref:hypothetical protein n=1 Tax=Paractinoplanes durhamensis TaxID=113563 RepID=UPI0019409824|nr:hypothetical protein [Actinoplanes durhamensis]
MKDLLYEQCGFIIPVSFTLDFVGLHGDDWLLAERDWEDIVALVLDTDAVDMQASGSRAIRQAVEAAAAFLHDDEVWPWCPICRRGTGAEDEVRHNEP